MNGVRLSFRELPDSGWQLQKQITADDWPLSVRAKDVLKSQKMDPDQIRSRRPALFEIAERMQHEASRLLAPKLTYRIWPVESLEGTLYRLGGGALLDRTPIAEYVRDVRFFVAVLFTVGGELDQLVREKSACRMAESLMADAVGNAAMAQFSHMISRTLQRMIENAGSGSAGLLLQPGIRTWPLADGQKTIFGLVDGSEIGVEIHESGLMTPNKTCSGIMAIGNDVTTQNQIAPCDMCMMHDTCPYRGTYTHD